MKMPPPQLYARWMRHFAIFICGAVVGSAVYTAVYHRNFNDLATLNIQLREQVADLQQVVDNYEKSQQKSRSDNVIRRVNVIVAPANSAKPLNELAKLELANRIEKDLQALVGTKPDPDHLYLQLETARSLLNDKIYPDVRGENYRVRMSMSAYIQPELRIWVTAAPFDTSQWNETQPPNDAGTAGNSGTAGGGNGADEPTGVF